MMSRRAALSTDGSYEFGSISIYFQRTNAACAISPAAFFPRQSSFLNRV